MRVIFMGSPEFSVPALRALHAAHEVLCVYSQPPKPAHRGLQETPCPVHRVATELGLPVRTPSRVRHDTAGHISFAQLGADVAVVAAYGLILPLPMLQAPRLGCWNIHASLLPRWRGAAPIHAAVLNGDTESGITIMQMEEGLDTGPILMKQSLALHSRVTTTELQDALSELGADLILRALAATPASTAQSEIGTTYAPKLNKTDGLLNWHESALTLERRVRAMNPWPGAYFRSGGAHIRVLDAIAEPDTGAPGTQISSGLVACGQGSLRLLRLQRPGRAAMDADAFLRGYALPGFLD